MRICIDIPDEFIDFPRENIEYRFLHHMRGVYVFYDMSEIPLYVGKTINLGVRLNAHASSSPFYLNSKFIRFYEEVEPWKIDVLETYLIHELKPEYNSDKTNYTEETIRFMLGRIDNRINFYEMREQALVELVDDYSEDFYDRQDFLTAKKTLEGVRMELVNLNLRRKHVLRRKVDESFTK